MSNLLHFLADLAVVPQKQESFERHPKTVIAAAGLSESYPATLDDRAAITTAFNYGLQAEDVRIAFGTCCFSDPGPDPEPNPDPGPNDEPNIEESVEQKDTTDDSIEPST